MAEGTDLVEIASSKEGTLRVGVEFCNLVERETHVAHPDRKQLFQVAREALAKRQPANLAAIGEDGRRGEVGRVNTEDQVTVTGDLFEQSGVIGRHLAQPGLKEQYRETFRTGP